MACDESVGDEMKGSYTVELSLLMGIILPVLVGIIYLGFWWHDQAFMQAAAHEAVCQASLHPEEEKAQSALETLVKGRLLGTTNVELSGSTGKKEAIAAGRGSFAMPGLLTNLFEKTNVSMAVQVHLNIEAPSRRIQKIRGIMKIADAVRGLKR